ncbi:hypothetical protein AK812_SmicGene39778 [Symbiodinium microadriaticum]|uniref:Uncharacterized protein n=1 Tax=Symbiodinium microadriaticum TaxID=2951 RepID=A0A1Q9CAD3_SYMMI|nr:hypothetical protein AK812_SmicGene39778 [Symbiodinium microadriaticum]
MPLPAPHDLPHCIRNRLGGEAATAAADIVQQASGSGAPRLRTRPAARQKQLDRQHHLRLDGLDRALADAHGDDLADAVGDEVHPGAAPGAQAEHDSGQEQMQQLRLTRPLRQDLHRLHLRQLIWSFLRSPVMIRGTPRIYPGWPRQGQLRKSYVRTGARRHRLLQQPLQIHWTAFLKLLREGKRRLTLMATTLLPRTSDLAAFPHRGLLLPVSAICLVMMELATALNPKTEAHSLELGKFSVPCIAGHDYSTFGWATPIRCLSSMPRRNILLLGGDFNCSAVAQDELMSLAQAHGLCFLNTWTRHVLYAFRAWALFQRSYRELRRQGKHQRKQLLINKLQQASQAAARKDIRALYQTIKLISPKQQRGKVRIRTVDGELLEPQSEHAEISDYFHSLFGTDQPDIIPTDRLQPVVFEKEELEASLQQLGTGRAAMTPLQELQLMFKDIPDMEVDGAPKRGAEEENSLSKYPRPSSKGQGMGKGPASSSMEAPTPGDGNNPPTSQGSQDKQEQSARPNQQKDRDQGWGRGQSWGGWHSKEWSSTSAAENNRLEDLEEKM